MCDCISWLFLKHTRTKGGGELFMGQNTDMQMQNYNVEPNVLVLTVPF